MVSCRMSNLGRPAVLPVALVTLLTLAASATAAPSIDATPLSAAGSQIIDATGQSLRTLSVGMWPESGASDKMATIAHAGFNAIRLDWSNRSIDKLAQLDRIIAAAGQAHLKVILDDHSNEAGTPGPWKPCYAQQVNGIWYDSGGASDGTDGCHDHGLITDAKFVQDWQTVAHHFLTNTIVIGYDLWNEPASYPGMSTWEPSDRNPDHNIRWMYERTGNEILAIDPTKLIICAGPMNAQHSFADPATPAPWGDLSLAEKYPVKLSVPHKQVYTVHDYPTEIGGYQPDAGPKKVAQMNQTWGYLVRKGLAPVWIGEMGANMTTTDHQQWAKTLIDYANGSLGADGGPTFGPGQQGIGINWWFAGHDPHGNPTGIFDALGKINEA